MTMKKLFILSGIIVLIISGCSYEDVYPHASFSAEYDLVEPNEVFSFYNTSYDAESFEWDFGDGYVSNLANPSHSYSQEGVYQVTLRAYYGSKVDVAYMNIEVYQTTLEVIVKDYKFEDLIVGIEVTLFANYTDWYDIKNAIINGYTDNNGSVIFKGVGTQSYFIDAYSSNFNNSSLGQEDVDFIKTTPLLYARHNVFIALVDEVTSTQKSSAETDENQRPARKQYIIKEVKRSVKDLKENLQSVKEKK